MEGEEWRRGMEERDGRRRGGRMEGGQRRMEDGQREDVPGL